ncbi:MAG: hypothetical protein VYC56_11375 [Actinomycetota bacterium]|nr:hypothetical protein [Actinomycetota bacterium]
MVGTDPRQGRLDLGSTGEPSLPDPGDGRDGEPGGTPQRVVRVLPGVAAIDRVFDYLVPEAWAADGRGDRLTVGSRVRVVLHGRRVAGWVVADHVEPPAGVALRTLARLSGVGPAADLIDLARWAAHRWAGPVSGFLATASPPTMIEALPAARRYQGPPAASPTPPDPRYEAAVSPDPVGRPAVVRLAPGDDPIPLLLAAARRGDTLVLVPTADRADRLARRLRRAGVPVSSMPRDWARAATGGVVVGSRAAAWAPVGDLRCVVVLDEHDEAYREERSPTWNARDVVIERARRAGAACVLASPVPSLEALAAAGEGSTGVRLVEPSRSTERAGWPVVDLVDRRRDDPVRSGLFSPSIVDVLRGDGGDPVVCVLNRKGRSRLLACDGCGELARCADHGSILVLERAAAAGDGPDEIAEPEEWLRCPVDDGRRPVVCDACGATRFRNLRAGVSRVCEELSALAGRPVAEVTADSPAADLARPGAPSLLVGTEAVLHRLERRAARVVFLEFDQELLAPRQRAAEQALALLARAARLLGPRSADGRLVVQTRQPGHEVLQAVLHADPARIVPGETARRRLLGLPPFGALARVSGVSAEEYVRRLEALPDRNEPGVDVLGPRDGSWLIRAPGPDALADLLAAVERPRGRLRVEVDPVRA